MPYEKTATGDTPAFVIYLIDLSGSMSELCGGKPRIDVVAAALERTKRVMLRRSRRGEEVRPRYAISMLGYSASVTDLLGGVKMIDELETLALPRLDLQGATNTRAGFEAVLSAMNQYIGNLGDCPAPLVCHLSDGGFNQGGDPRPIVDQIRSMGNSDGNVLVENIYVGDRLLRSPISDAKSWPGVTDPSQIADNTVMQLLAMSSPLPDSYAGVMAETEGYSMQSGVPMLIPAETPDLIDLAFVMSSATPTNPGR